MPKGRASHFIRRKPASNLYHAIRIAERSGVSLTHHVTINFTRLACPDTEVSQKFRWLRGRWTDWMRRPSRRGRHLACKPADAWTIEGAGGVQSVHWMMHLPAGRIKDCKARLAGWIKTLAGGAYPANAIQVDPITFAPGLGRYIMKGIEPAFAGMYGVTPQDQGVVVDKRSGFSQCLGPAVKKKMRVAGTYPRARPWSKYSEQHAKAAYAAATQPTASGGAAHPVGPASAQPSRMG